LCGNYTLSDANGTPLASGGGGFGASQTNTFCISNGIAALTAPKNNDSFFDAKIQENIQLNIRPNIVQDQIHINYFTKNNYTQFYIINVDGQVLGKYLGNENGDITLNVSDLKAGYYFLQMISGNEVITKKFVKI